MTIYFAAQTIISNSRAYSIACSARSCDGISSTVFFTSLVNTKWLFTVFQPFCKTKETLQKQELLTSDMYMNSVLLFHLSLSECACRCNYTKIFQMTRMGSKTKSELKQRLQIMHFIQGHRNLTFNSSSGSFVTFHTDFVRVTTNVREAYFLKHSNELTVHTLH